MCYWPAGCLRILQAALSKECQYFFLNTQQESSALGRNTLGSC
nr:MAG TPA: hypothetical protein [Caudoviricetes sp.]